MDADNGQQGSETKKVSCTWLEWGPGPEQAVLQPHRFFRGSAPKTCRTAVLLSDCTETGEKKSADQVMVRYNLLSLTCRLSPRGARVPTCSTKHLSLGRPSGQTTYSFPFQTCATPTSEDASEANALPSTARTLSLLSLKGSFSQLVAQTVLVSPQSQGPYFVGSKLHPCLPLHQCGADLHDHGLYGVGTAPALGHGRNKAGSQDTAS